MLQDDKTGELCAFKLSTQRLLVLDEDQDEETLDDPKFLKKLHDTNWHYRWLRASEFEHALLDHQPLPEQSTLLASSLVGSSLVSLHTILMPATEQGDLPEACYPCPSIPMLPALPCVLCMLCTHRCFEREVNTYTGLGCEDSSSTTRGLPHLKDYGITLLPGKEVHAFVSMTLLGQ
jgi:hypothetical protein